MSPPLTVPGVEWTRQACFLLLPSVQGRRGHCPHMLITWLRRPDTVEGLIFETHGHLFVLKVPNRG